MSEGGCSVAGMEQNPCLALQSLSSSDLLAATHALVQKSHGLEADLLVHLGEIDDRKLYLERGHPSMFAFCVVDLRFSDDVAYNRIMVARAGRRLPAVIEVARSGDVHLAGLRLLSPHLTLENHRAILAEATGKSKRDIELIVARLAPLPPVPATIRRVPESPVVAALLLRSRSPISPVAPAGASGLAPDDTAAPGNPQAPLDTSGQPAADSGPRSAVPDSRRAEVKPLSETTFRVQFTAGRSLCDKLKEAQDLLRHRLPGGDMAAIF